MRGETSHRRLPSSIRGRVHVCVCVDVYTQCLCVRMYIRIRTHTYVCTCMYPRLYVRLCIRIYVDAGMYVRAHTYVCVRVHGYVHICVICTVCAYVRVDVPVRVCVYRGEKKFTNVPCVERQKDSVVGLENPRTSGGRLCVFTCLPTETRHHGTRETTLDLIPKHSRLGSSLVLFRFGGSGVRSVFIIRKWT